jgi:hypothetical protein
LATSVSLNDLAVDPTQPGDKKKLVILLRDIVFDESCLDKEA